MSDQDLSADTQQPLVRHHGPWTREPVPDTWCVVVCEQGCLETWTVDTIDFDPVLTARDVEELLTPLLLAHEREEHR